VKSIVTKFIAFILAACTFVGAVACVLGISALAAEGLYDTSLEEKLEQEMERLSYSVAIECAERYAAENLGSCPNHLVQSIFGNYFSNSRYIWSAKVLRKGQLLAQVGTMPEDPASFSHSFVVSYPATLPLEGTQPNRTATVTIWEDGVQKEYELYYYNSPEYTVQIFMQPLETDVFTMLDWLYAGRYQLIFWAAISLLVAAACVVFLCCVAGKTPGRAAVRPGGLNRLPLDLYAVLVGLLGVAGCAEGMTLWQWTFNDGINYGGLILGLMLAVLLTLLALAFLFALAAQLKTKGGYWWRNTLFGRAIRAFARVLELLPVIWQWLLTAAVMALGVGVSFFLAMRYRSAIWDVVFGCVILACVGVVLYGGYAFGVLLWGIHRMNSGSLDHKISTTYLIGSFRTFAQALNTLSDSAMMAAQNQLKSERMKTELITNVSHDIKTPLTSLINYVDLLQKPHTEQEETAYLEVLSRQSLRLKKLIDDLMEMSKASTGNLTVDITDIDVTEAVNQALGEFSGKFAKARLIPVFSSPEEQIMMKADGRLVWRVLSNLLGNAVKYAMPGTRIYIDTARTGGQVLISIKNISAEPLNVSSEELMERFVRGDASRNTEGSGLGLNIAKSLMEVQKGQLSLLVDGDLFKVTLLFPGE
jgi:signal transduction histidine kinase